MDELLAYLESVDDQIFGWCLRSTTKGGNKVYELIVHHRDGTEPTLECTSIDNNTLGFMVRPLRDMMGEDKRGKA